MKAPRSRWVFAAVTIGIGLALGACAGRDVSGGPDAAPTLVLPTDMVFMPVADERPPKPDAVDIRRDVRNAAVRLLGKRGYVATPRDELEKEGVAAPPTLHGTSGEALAALAPESTSPLVFVAVERVDEGYGYGGEEYRVVLSGLIVDTKSSRIVWEGTGTGSTSLGGLLRIFSPQSTTYDAVYEAVRDLFRPLPKNAMRTSSGGAR